MSSGFRKKNNDDEPGFFGSGSDHSRKKGLWSSGQDPATSMPGPGSEPVPGGHERGMDWKELEKKYDADFDSRADHNEPPFSRSYPYGQREKYEGAPAGQNQAENDRHHHGHFDDFDQFGDEKNHDQKAADRHGKPYREEDMQVTKVRGGGHKKVSTHHSDRFSNRKNGGGKAPPDTLPVHCAACGGQVSFRACVECIKFKKWDEKDQGPRCYHEYEDLESRGHYDGTWEKHPENFTPEEWNRYQEDKRRNEEINRQMEREKSELNRLAKKFQEERQSADERLKERYGDTDETEDVEDGDYDIDDDDDETGNDGCSNYDHLF